MRTVVGLAIVVLSATGGEIAVTHAMKQIGEVTSFTPRSVLRALGQAFRLGWMWSAIGLLAVSFFSLLVLLSWANVSFVIPATAVSYVVGALGARFLLGERVNVTRWAGILLVSLGVALVALGQ